MLTSTLNLQKMQLDQLQDLAEFIVTENFKHHSNNTLPEDYLKDIDSIYKEEMRFYRNSQIYVSRDTFGDISGAIRVLKWNLMDVLPIEKIFGIDPIEASQKTTINGIYHIGRFAIKREVKDIQLFKQLMVCAIAPICEHEDNIAYAEIDAKLLRVLTLLGIETTVVGESIQYLGSETIPVMMTAGGLMNFYNKNRYLVGNQVELPARTYILPESVVFAKSNHTTL